MYVSDAIWFGNAQSEGLGELLESSLLLKSVQESFSTYGNDVVASNKDFSDNVLVIVLSDRMNTDYGGDGNKVRLEVGAQFITRSSGK